LSILIILDLTAVFSFNARSQYRVDVPVKIYYSDSIGTKIKLQNALKNKFQQCTTVYASSAHNSNDILDKNVTDITENKSFLNTKYIAPVIGVALAGAAIYAAGNNIDFNTLIQQALSKVTELGPFGYVYFALVFLFLFFYFFCIFFFIIIACSFLYYN
jgi:hypothetical protein